MPISYSILITVVGARIILDAAEVPLHPDAGRVVRVGQLQAGRSVVIEAQYLSRDAGEILQASVGS